MSKKVVIISSSPRYGGNSDILALEAKRGAEDKGYETVKFNLSDLEISFCRSCDYCHTKGAGKCSINDDMKKILQELLDCHALVMATPIYFDEMSGQLKTMIDRTYARYENLKISKMAFIATSAEDDENIGSAAIMGFRGFLRNISGAKEAGILYVNKVAEKGDVREDVSAMKKAYDLGYSL